MRFGTASQSVSMLVLTVSLVQAGQQLATAHAVLNGIS